MKKKILAIFMLLILVFTNYVYAGVTIFERKNGGRLNSIAKVISSENPLYLDSKFSAKSHYVKNGDIKIYDENDKEITEETSPDNFIWDPSQTGTSNPGGSDPNSYELYVMKLKEGKNSNKRTVRIQNAIEYNDNGKSKRYNVKMVIGQIRVDNATINETTSPEIRIRYKKGYNEQNPAETNTFNPLLYVAPTKTGKVEVDVDYYIVDENDKNVAVDGIIDFTDIDINQGVFIENYQIDSNNAYVKPNTTGNLKYTSQQAGSYLYTTSDENLGLNENDQKCDAYLKMENFKHARFVFTFEGLAAGSNINFVKNYKYFHKITTSVKGGTITKSITEIKDGETKDITYAPNNANTQYLKSIKVDNQETTTTDYPEKYTFSNINEDHTIEVEYANKLRVTFDSNGGTEVTPNPQYVIPNDKATKPADPTRTGYTFDGWVKKGTNTKFDVTNTKITENTDLVAKWTPIEYKITYETDGGTNAPSNPPTYTINSVVDFKDPTKDGYVFKGWYTDPELTKPIYGIPLGSTGDKTIYAKWEKKQENPQTTIGKYTVEHYFQNTNGDYTKLFSNVFAGIVGDNITCPDAQYPGYTENTNHPNKVISGTINADGSLVLRRYFDLNEAPTPEEPAQTTAKYTVEHYMQNSNGEYEKVYSNEFTGKIDDTVECPETIYYGYNENTNHENRVISGKVKADGSLVLRRYYDSNNTTPVASSAQYKIEYYKQTSNGEYEIATTSNQEGTVGSTVTIPEANYDGYKENTSNPDRVISGEIKADGSLVLRRYYDKIDYKVTFDPQNDTTIPDQTVPYADKATKPTDPTKDGYTFMYWYYLDDNNQAVVYDFDTPVSKDIDLIARWEENKQTTPEPKTDDTVTPKTDNTITEKTLPKTGIIGKTLMSVLVISIVGIIFAIRYRKLKDIK